jgi:hypothetical protein
LKKAINRHNKLYPGQILQVIRVPCMDLCPKNGVTVYNPFEPSRVSILRGEGDIERLY